VYTLDIETMSQIMLAHKKTGHLYADLPSGLPGLRESCSVTIVLETGKIVSCSIANDRGFLLTGDKAYRELSHLGRLRWTFVTRSLPDTRSGLVARSLEEKMVISRPRRIVAVEQWQMRRWQRMHRLVYRLADGTKSVAEIAILLSTNSEIIEETLRDLGSIGVIVLE
jgi:hypothetical protein